MPRNAFGSLAFCAIVLALAACAAPAPRAPAPVSAPIPSPAPPMPSTKPATTPAVASAKGPIVLGSRGFEEGKRRIKAALAKNAADALPPGDVGYYVDVLQGRLKQVASQQVGIIVGRQGNDVILDLSSRLDFDAGTARITPGIRDMLAPIVAVLAEYRMMLVAVNASSDDAGDGVPDIRLDEQRGLAVARHLAGAGVAPGRIVVAGSSVGRTTQALAETRTHIEIHLEPIIRTADTTRAVPAH